ncbi:aminotransferase class I/II-fold pyridoxal phosphate-dependent enzyme [Paracoccus sp. NGMCC 1.201697]|uniref:Aminotransferase class I/II-fold pyridoxal phosphate-dependent enzyme n=1 Tax=Paracoccus broussonetiae subsp. drimophilus TaxID=3373869 RepID=A0ABW7LKR1_9RHOB
MTLSAHQGLLDSLAQRQRLRELRPVQGIDFASNDYLGLRMSPLLGELANAALQSGIPVGSGAARLLRGNHDPLVALEAEAAAFFGTGGALYFGSGFAANLAIFSALPQARDLVLHDALLHASSRDGIRLGRAESRAFAHNDLESLRQVLRDWRRDGGMGRVWIAVESLYSMDGDLAPVAALAALAEAEDAFLIVDEAHATGVLGPGGRGIAAGLAGQERIVLMHGCGKALAVQGAFVCAAPTLISVLVNRARSFIYSTAPSPLLAQILRGVLAHLAQDATRRLALQARVDRIAVRARQIGLAPSGSHIQPVPVPGDARSLAASEMLAGQGFDIRAIRAPTVPKGAERLRLSITMNPEDGQIDMLFDLLGHLAAKGDIG